MSRITDALSLSWMLQTLIGFSLLILLVLVLRKPVARRFGAGAAYALWLLPLIRLVLPPVAVPASWTAWFNRQMPPEVIPAEAVPMLAALPAATSEVAANAALPVAPVMTQISPAVWTLGLALVWLALALSLLARTFFQHRSFVRVLEGDHEPVSPALQQSALRLAQEIGLKHPPHLTASLVVASPLVLASKGHTHCIVPAWFEADFTPAEQDAALVHEFMHVRRGDLIALKVCALVTSVFWFNPLVWIGARAFRVDQESACDADVLRRTSISPHTYGATLLKAVRGGRFGAAPLAASLPLTHALKERLTRMKDGPSLTKFRTLWLGLAGITGLGVAIATATVSAEAHDGQSVRITGGTLYIDGQKLDDRRFELRGDPMAGITPPAPPAPMTPPAPPAGLAGGEDADGSWFYEMDYAHTMPPEIDAEIATFSAEIAREGTEIAALALRLASAEMRGDTSRSAELERAIAAREAAIEAKAAALEARSAEFEARMEAWSEQFEARMEAQTIALERRLDADAEALEARLEADAEAMEAQFDAENDRFEDQIEDRARVVHELAEKCRDAELAPGEKRTVRATANDGQSFEAECEDTQTQ